MSTDILADRAPLDPRVSSALDAFTQSPDATTPQRITSAISAADASDAEQGIHRISVDDETVERIAFVLGTIYSRGDEFDVGDYTRKARKILDALVARPAAPSWGDQLGDVH